PAIGYVEIGTPADFYMKDEGAPMAFLAVTRRHCKTAGKSLAAVGVLVVLLFPSASMAHADTKKILMIVPNAMKRTAVNMVTFRNRELGLMQWMDVAACLADA